MKKSPSSYPDGFFDLDSLVIRDKTNHPIRHLTISQIALMLDAVLYHQKTGVILMANAAEPRIIVSYNSFAKIVGLDPLKKSEWTATEKKKILTEITEHFDAWVSNVGPFSGAGIAETVDPAFAKRAPKLLHGIFDQMGDEMKLDGVAAIIVMQSKDDDSVPVVRTQLRLLAESNPDKWHLTGGPSPQFIRLKAANGKAAGSIPAAKAPNGGKTFERFTSTVRGFGIASKAEFEKAKKDLGKDSLSADELKKWVESE